METRQPDEVGTLGQEAARALNRLHSFSSKRNLSCFISLLYPVIFGASIGLWNRNIVPSLAKRYGGLPDDWQILALVGALGVTSLMHRLYNWLRRTKAESVTFHRSNEEETHPTSRPQIWTASSFFVRSLWPFVAFCVGTLALIVLLRNPYDKVRSLLALTTLVCFYQLVQSVETIFHPLIRVDENGLQIKRDKLLWSQIERVQIKVDLYNSDQTHWHFFDAQNKRLAKAVLRNSSLDTQKDVASTIAQVLHALPEENPPFTLSERVTGDSYIPTERPY